ncbi:MAG TPA: hypothetical protein VFC23_15385 [Thermoanaerobaculia bacterium]|nr:hypothetical protein [Thermoanaerobaculia bacterium]
MADDEGIGGLIGALFMLVLVVTAVILAVMALMSVGALFGAGTALRNYGLAFSNNIKPERATT